jgi:hypothetical protein
MFALHRRSSHAQPRFRKDKGDKKGRAASAAPAAPAVAGPPSLGMPALEKRLAEIAPAAPSEMLTEIAEKIQRPLIAQFQVCGGLRVWRAVTAASLD